MTGATAGLPPWGRADRDALRSMTAEGLTDGEIGAALGRTPKAVAAERRRLRVRKHGRVRRRVLRLLAAGYTTAAAALMVGRSEQTVRAIRAANTGGPR